MQAKLPHTGQTVNLNPDLFREWQDHVADLRKNGHVFTDAQAVNLWHRIATSANPRYQIERAKSELKRTPKPQLSVMEEDYAAEVESMFPGADRGTIRAAVAMTRRR